MTLSIAFGESRTIPASQQAKSIMKQLANKRLFPEQGDVWRLGASLGIALGQELEAEKKGTFQNINSLDPEEVFASIMIGLYPAASPDERVKKLVNYAEWGIREIARREKIGTMDWTTLGLPDKRKSEKRVSEEEEIKSILKKDESVCLEFKSSFRWDIEKQKIGEEVLHSFLKSVAGFSNAKKGGTLIVGVDASGKVLGLEDDYKNAFPKNRDGLEQLMILKISEMISTECAHDIEIGFLMIEGKDVCRIRIQPGASPVYLEDMKTKNKQFYLRMGNATRSLGVQETAEWCLKRFK